VSLLTLNGVEAGFGSNTVLHGVDLEVTKGSSLGVFGLNGAGKSVTMKVIAGLVPARDGTVKFRETDVTGMSPENRARMGMAYMSQGRQLFGKLTVEQNIRLGTSVLRKRNRNRSREVVRDVYERFPLLDERRTQQAGSLSGGEQAMLAIGRALASDPEVLLIDEPSAGLAPAVIDTVFGMLQQLRKDGMTIVLVEQNVTFGFRLVDRAAIMQSGRIVYEGAVGALDTPKVANLLGVGRLLGSRLNRVMKERRTGAKPARKTRTHRTTKTKKGARR
jgi:branched-chain amino acid transport system ATP-binding protein